MIQGKSIHPFPHCGAVTAVALLLTATLAPTVYAAAKQHSVREIQFPARQAAAVRLVILASSDGGQPCVDELETYGPDSDDNLALDANGAVASASSCLPGYAIHAIEHLNDGEYGNNRSWIPKERRGGWAQITFPEPVTIDRVVFSRDRYGRFTDRLPTRIEIHVLGPDGEWTTVEHAELSQGDPDAIPNPPGLERRSRLKRPVTDPLPAAFFNEEYAWLKAFGRVDFHPELSRPRYGMEREGPRHVGDDRLPLPRLSAPPRLDGKLDDGAWQAASRGVVRVASLAKRELAPLVEQAVIAGIHGEDLYLAVQADRFLSKHLAVVSGEDWIGCGVVLRTRKGLLFNTYAGGRIDKSLPLDAAANKDETVFEFRLPLSLFPTAAQSGLRVGLGLGGKHTPKQGRPVHFVPSDVSIAEASPCADGTFQVRIGLAEDGSPVTLGGNIPALRAGLTLEPGQSKVLSIAAEDGPIGPERNLEIRSSDGESYVLHLFRYDPTAHVLRQAEELADRLSGKGLDVSEEHEDLAGLRARQAKYAAETRPNLKKERQLLADARAAKRALFLREPDLAPLEEILFVRREPFRPSHNYSVILDAPWRPGGSISLLHIPRRNGCLDPAAARVDTLFDAGEGIARNPMANFDCSTVYFAYKPTQDGYFHLYRAEPDGANLRKLTDGPFHDYWPCPLPDGGLAFISTRCKRRFLCWRPQAATLHRMDADGTNLRALSYANLTEWAPSVMDDGRIIWTRSEYQDKAADFGHTLWAIRPDGTHPELVFGNTITIANGYANGRYMPGANEVACTLISHFGDLNGPIALLDLDQGRFNPDAITSITPEVFWPGSSPANECFRDPVPIARDYVLCSHASANQFDLYVIDRSGNRELLYADPDISSMCPTLFRKRTPPPALPSTVEDTPDGTFLVRDVYQGIMPEVQRGQVAYLSVSIETTHDLEQLANGEFRNDHEPFQQFYASPSDVLAGPYGWPTYAVKESLGTVPVQADGSAYFRAPSGKVLFFHLLDDNYNELQRMRSVVQLQPGEQRSCTGCHEDRKSVAPPTRLPMALADGPIPLTPPPWGVGPFSFERVVQPVLDAHCAGCHDEEDPAGLNFTAALDQHRIPASYTTLISKGLVHYADWTWSNPDVCKKLPPLSLGTIKSKLWETLNAGHYDVALTVDEQRAIKTWIDLNCPLWADYTQREQRPAQPVRVAHKP